MLVRPRQFPHAEATARASGADDVLARARVVGTLAEALAGCGFVAATTSRDRDQNFRVLDVREAAARIVAEARRAPAAVLFGAERTGLHERGARGRARTASAFPPTTPTPSLNLAMAVQLVAYELFRAPRQPVDHEQPGEPRRWPRRERWSGCTPTWRRCWRRSISATARRAAPI